MPWLGNRYVRWSTFFTCLGILVSAGALPAGGVDTATEAADPLWPLDLGTRYLTSNFMEYRSGRFHAGLDLKTQSQSGFAARAVEDGSIVRVRATPFAYGRAVYLLGESGRTYVYAHLSRFNDPIRAKVLSAREKSGKYRVRLHFEPGEMKVRQGEVLGLTGESGTGGPHLHFEVRDPDNRPVNPMHHGFAVPDTLAPVIYAVRAIPADSGSRIDGEPPARIVKGTPGLSGELPALQIAGPVAFAAKIIDASDIAGHRLEPWLIEVRLDGDLVYQCRNDRFDFSQNSLQRLEWLEVPGVRDHWLHRRTGNSLTGRLGEEWFRGPDGSGLDPGPHTLEILAADAAGNESRVIIPLMAANIEFPQPPVRGGWRMEPVYVGSDSLPDNNLHPFVEVNGEADELDVIYLLTPDKGDPVLAPTLLARGEVRLSEDQIKQSRRQGLEGTIFSDEYLAADWPIDAGVIVTAPYGGKTLTDSLPAHRDPALMVYRWSGKKWSPAGPLLEPAPDDSVHRFALANPGLHAVFRDMVAPVIFPADTVISIPEDPRGQSHGVTLPRWEIFPVDLLDLGSGIATETIQTTLDGVALIVEPDLPRNRILVELPDDLPPGGHILRVKAADKAGNEADAEVLLQCHR